MDSSARLVVRRALAEHHRPVVEDAGLQPAGVVALVYGRGDESVVLLSKRSEALDRHPGEISFPGGRCEVGDRSLMHTALRETSEEVGVNPEDVEVLGELGRFTTITDYVISCFVGAIDHPYEFKVNSAEVDRLLEVPLSALLDRRTVRDDVRVVDGDLVTLPSFAYDGDLIFGATARILDRLLEVLSTGGAGQAIVPVVSDDATTARPAHV